MKRTHAERIALNEADKISNAGAQKESGAEVKEKVEKVKVDYSPAERKKYNAERKAK